MLEPDEEIPDDRCGFVLQPENCNNNSATVESREWANSYQPSTCVRDTWRDGRCIWHADVADKPTKELQASRTDGPESFDGAVLIETEFPDSVSFRNCSFISSRWQNSRVRASEFTDSDLRHAIFTDSNFVKASFSYCIAWKSDFDNTRLTGAKFIDSNFNLSDFRDSDLWRAEFKDVSLIQTNFTETYLKLAEFPESNLTQAEFEESHLTGAKFSNADLDGATFSSIDISRADFSNASLEEAKFPRMSLSETDFTDANLMEADFSEANLQDAVLTRAECRGTDFTDARLYETVFADTRINSSTTFYDPDNRYSGLFASRPPCVYEENPLTDYDLDDDTHPLEAARWVYRRLETLHEENAMSEEAREFHISKEEAERKLYAERGEWRSRLTKGTMRWLTRHGESVQRTITWWLFVILAFGLTYPFVGGIKDSKGVRYEIVSLSELATFEGRNDLLLNIYFSGITFSTIGYGDLSPAAPGTRTLVFVESLVGAVLVALLVFVLGRRVAR